jgi:GAF domain-containing protein
MENVPVRKQTFNPEAATYQLYKSWRKKFALPLLIGVLVFGAVALYPAVRASNNLFINSIFITTYLMTGVVAVVRFPYAVRMGVFLASVYMLGLGELLTYGILGDSLFFFLALIVFATILFSPKAGLAAMAFDVATFIAVGWLILNGQFSTLNPNATPAVLEDWISASAATVMFGAVIILGFQRLEHAFLEAQKQIDSTLNTLQEERNTLEDRVQERTTQLRKINEIGRTVASLLDAEEVVRQAAQFIQKEFNCYFTAIYLIDTAGQWAEIREASGEAGKVLKENKRRLDLNSRNSITDVIREKQGAIISDSQVIRSENPLLPYTRSQIVLPLIVGETVLGALDMHLTDEGSFSQQDVDAYQNMANGIAIAIENANLFQESRQSLLEMQATQRQYIEGAWQSFASEKELEYALGDGDPSLENKIEIPLSLRGQVIGQIQMTHSSEWTSEQKNLIEAIAAQATLALENARLVEQSQTAAIQERMANEIIAKIWASGNMDSILQTAARELGRSLDASEVEIEVGMGDIHEK